MSNITKMYKDIILYKKHGVEDEEGVQTLFGVNKSQLEQRIKVFETHGFDFKDGKIINHGLFGEIGTPELVDQESIEEKEYFITGMNLVFIMDTITKKFPVYCFENGVKRIYDLANQETIPSEIEKELYKLFSKYNSKEQLLNSWKHDVYFYFQDKKLIQHIMDETGGYSKVDMEELHFTTAYVFPGESYMYFFDDTKRVLVTVYTRDSMKKSPFLHVEIDDENYEKEKRKADFKGLECNHRLKYQIELY